MDTAESIAPDTPDAEQPPAPSPTSYAAQSEALILHRETCSKLLPWRKPRKWHGPEEVERLTVFCFWISAIRMLGSGLDQCLPSG